MAPSSSGPGENFSRARAVCVRVRPADTSPKRQRGGGRSRCWRSGLVSLAPLSTRTEFPVERWSPVHFSRWPFRRILPPATRRARTALVRVNSLSQVFRRTLKRYEEGLRMRTRLLLAVVVLALPGTTPARADHIKDPAELMPAKSVVYVELHQPGQLVKEIASLFEGSALGNVPDSLTKLFDRGERPRGSEPLGAAGLLFAPEVIRELQRIRGAGVAFTGMGKMGPEGVAVILPGDSNGPPFLMRAFLAAGPVRPAGEVEGVKLYQLALGGGARFKQDGPRPPRRPDDPRTSPPRETKPDPRNLNRGDGKVAEQLGRRDDRAVLEEREGPLPGPVFAMTDEALLIGTVDAVKDTVSRIKGKA